MPMKCQSCGIEYIEFTDLISACIECYIKGSCIERQLYIKNSVLNELIDKKLAKIIDGKIELIKEGVN
jgi:hypothetical protein